MTIYTTIGLPGYRPMEFKAYKNGLIMARVVGKGKLFTWGRWGTLAPGDTMAEFAKRKGLVDGSIKFTKKRWADSDPHHPANVLMCAAIEKAEGR